MKQTKNLIKTEWDLTLLYKNPKDPEIEKIAKERALICARCPFNVDNKCNKCGCYLPAKTRSINSKCPDGKW